MYDQPAQMQLREKLDYELWLLDFLSNMEDIFTGGKDISTITLTNRQSVAHVAVSVTEVLGSGQALEVMNAINPLTFTASYKVLDMIFEWILEGNRNAGKISDVPWRFSKKIKKIQNSSLFYPPLFQSQPYIRNYLFALYSNLLKFRNEIVHRNRFSVSDGKLQVATKKGCSHTLELSRSELGVLVRIVVAVANLLTGNLPFGRQVDRLLKYHLDRLQKLHGLGRFKQVKPLLVNVTLKVPREEGTFPADLKFVRQQVNRIHPNADVQFNLEVIGLVNDEPCIGWFIPVDAVPERDLLELQSNSLKGYRISLSKEAQ